MKRLLLFVCLFVAVKNYAQQTFPNNGPADRRDGKYAFTNATIIKSWNEKIEGATLLIAKGKIEAVGKNIPIPADAVTIDLKGKYIYPSFLDLYADYGMPEAKAEAAAPAQRPQMLSNKKGAFAWNEALKVDFRANENFLFQAERAKNLRNVGFGATLSHRFDGISRGTATLVTLADVREHEAILKAQAAHILTFSKGTSTQDYPNSLMGGIALLRQTYYDAQWYRNQKEEYNASLEAWNNVAALPQVFAVGGVLEALRADKIAKEFNLKYLIKGTGDEYKRLDELKKTGASLILPVKFPEAYDVEDPYDALQVDLADLKHWEIAPTNLARVAKAGINFAITSHGLKNTSDFLTNLRKAVENGLSEDIALKALTQNPAEMMGATALLGSLEKDKIANFFIASANIFTKESKIYENWCNGKRLVVNDMNVVNLNGDYDVILPEGNLKFKITGSVEKPDIQAIKDTVKSKVEYQIGNGTLTLSFSPEGKNKNFYRLSANINDGNWAGRGQNSNGDWFSWTAKRSAEATAEVAKNDAAKTENTIGELYFPALAFGNTTIPTAKTYLFKNATVWTNEKEGIMKNADVLVQNGKIAQVGTNLVAKEAIVVDASNKHLTSGIIDEHSHIGISRGVNEGSQESTAEVRIGDVVNSEDINIYRNLAGGVTGAHLLHGSANPIGGQTQLIKLRWGYAPEAMKFANWDGFIKFALGENVKQSGAPENARIRYPQTRMGVEQVYEDYFTRAEEYAKLKASGKPYRKDLDLETIQEILEKKRFITCHSYVQSEINMLIKLAERHNFRINTFTHILEGYKVADKMAKHGVGGSSFSDWWDYKVEVFNAIPQNPGMMHEQGVTVAVNSDDAEMSRRLNQEAAKSVQYAGTPEEEAWKFVTLNPAKLLHVADRTGSIKVGKDADVVLWSSHPMSVYAKAEMTLVDGIKFFDIQEDMQKQGEVRKERERIIQKMIVAKKNGESTQAPQSKGKKMYHCEDNEDEMRD
jgi:imidazolonepropionase-like amidohydrolase